MTTQAITLLNDVAAELIDPGFVRWTKAMLLSYLNDGQRQIALVRPDASSKVANVLLAAGASQALPSDGLRLMDVYCNMGTGSTPGKALRIVSRDPLNATDSSWYSEASASVIDEVMFDERFPKRYWVNPPSKSSPAVYISIGYSFTPVTLTSADTDPIGLDDIYAVPLRQWMLHRSYALNTQSTIARQRSEDCKKDFYTSLGLKAPADKSVSPNDEAING